MLRITEICDHNIKMMSGCGKRNDYNCGISMKNG